MSNDQVKIATCQTCHFPIYQGDLIHQSSTGSQSGTIDTGGVSHGGRGTTVHGSHDTYSGTIHTDQWIQCQWCIDEWNKELVELKEWNWKYGMIIWLSVPIISSVVVATYLKGKGILFGLFIGLLISAVVWWVVKKCFAPKPSRYRFRGYRQEKKIQKLAKVG